MVPEVHTYLRSEDLTAILLHMDMRFDQLNQKVDLLVHDLTSTSTSGGASRVIRLVARGLSDWKPQLVRYDTTDIISTFTCLCGGSISSSREDAQVAQIPFGEQAEQPGCTVE